MRNDIIEESFRFFFFVLLLDGRKKKVTPNLDDLDYSADPEVRSKAAMAVARSSYNEDDPYDRNLSPKTHYKHHQYDSAKTGVHVVHSSGYVLVKHG